MKRTGMRLAAGLLAVSAPVLPGMTAEAQLLTRQMFRGLEKSDVSTLQPLIRDSLSNDAVGATRPWSSPSGKRGFVQLLDGGANAGVDHGTMKITLVRADQTTSSIIFKYQQDAKGRWRTVG